jgi:hypothetical protein
MVRKIAILAVVSLLALFVWLNWGALSAATPISLGWVTVRAPLGLVLLVPLLVLCVLLPAWAISLHARVLRDVRAITKALQQRDLADREEAARLVDLRIDFLRALEEGLNRSQPYGELETGGGANPCRGRGERRPAARRRQSVQERDRFKLIRRGPRGWRGVTLDEEGDEKRASVLAKPLRRPFGGCP